MNKNPQEKSTTETKELKVILVKSLVGLAIYLAIFSAFVGFLSQNDPKANDPIQFEQALAEELIEVEPNYVFIGNSMLYTRIDEPTLNKLLGSDVVTYATGGSASAKWYLYLKNFVVPNVEGPTKLFLFFRNNMLTRPHSRTTGKYAAEIETLKTEDEPVYDMIMGGDTLSYKDRLLEYLHKDAYQEKLKDSISSMTVDLLNVEDGEKFLEQVNEEFGLDNLRETESGDQDQEEEDPNDFNFHTALETSFLPEMVYLAEENGIDIVFIRVRKRPDENGDVPQTEELLTYIEDLTEYLTVDHDFTLYDFTYDKDIPLEWYKDGDHIDTERTVEYTNYFYNKLIHEFE